MNDLLPGWTVAREIPSEVIAGLSNGRYSLQGGVIRGAPGTENAGEIVRHLLPAESVGATETVSSVFGPPGYHLPSLIQARATPHILQAVTGAMLLSGLNLTVSAVGFAVVCKRLRKIDAQLQDLFREVERIRRLLEVIESSKLEAALDMLFNGIRENNTDLIQNSLKDVAAANVKYRTLLSEANTLDEAAICEEYFFLTSLAVTASWAELEMWDTSRRKLDDYRGIWAGQARRIANEHLIGGHPERLLCSEFVEELPGWELVELLDFANPGNDEHDCLDELRKSISWNSVVSGQKRWFPSRRWSRKNRAEEIRNDKEKTIPLLRKLAARDKAFQGYVAQHTLLAEHGITPSMFKRKIDRLDPGSFVDGYLVLQPAPVAA